MSGLYLETCASNLKSVTLTVLELFAFNSHFKLVRLTGPLRTHRQKHTHRTNTLSIRHSLRFVHLAKIIKDRILAISAPYTSQNCTHSALRYRNWQLIGVRAKLHYTDTGYEHQRRTRAGNGSMGHGSVHVDP